MRIKCLMLSGMMILSTANVVLGGDKLIETKRTTQARAAAIDFGNELGLHYASLAGLGGRIDAARDACDPVAIALASVELGADEKASGKSADLKAVDLAAEAVELAKERYRPEELKSVAAVLGGDPDAAELNEVAVKAEQIEISVRRMKESGAQVKAKGIMGTLHIDNHTKERLTVFIDGNFVGTVGPFGDGFFNIGQSAWETTYISYRGSDGGLWNANVSTPVGEYMSVVR